MKHVAVFPHSAKPMALELTGQALQELHGLSVISYLSPEIAARLDANVLDDVRVMDVGEMTQHVDIVLVIGGDGTMLRAASAFLKSEIPLIGVNVGKLGFLAEFSADQLSVAIETITGGTYRIVDRTAIEAEFAGEHFVALNDFVVEKHSTSRMIVVTASLGDMKIADYRSDGLILTTPTGSTAYSLSAGGPIIAPTSEVFCLTPICPHTLTLRPLVFPNTYELTLRLEDGSSDASLVADGQILRNVSAGQSIIVRKSDHVVKLVKRPETTYFELLRRKLLWSSEGR